MCKADSPVHSLCGFFQNAHILPSWLAKSAVQLDVAGSARLIVQPVSFPIDNKMYSYHKSSSTCLKTCSIIGNYCLPSQECLSLVLITGYEVEGLGRPRMVNEESQNIMWPSVFPGCYYERWARCCCPCSCF